MTVAGGPGGEGALAAVLPAAARSFWSDDVGLAAELGQGRGSSQPDVAVLTHPRHLASAPPAGCVVLLLDGTRGPVTRGGRAADAVSRLAAHARLRAQVRAAQQGLQRLGHRQVRVLSWDSTVPLVDEGERPARAAHRVESYPRRAVVVAGPPDRPTVLDDVLGAQQATRSARSPLVVTQGGTVLAATDRGLLRVGVGRGTRQVAAPAAVLARLGREELGPVGRCVPALLAEGRCGPAVWTLEQLMPGGPVQPPVPAAVRRDCVDLLVALHRVPHDGPAGATGAAAAEVGELSGRPRDVRLLLDDALERAQDLPRGWAHGDFWHRNLLVEHGRLSAVVDWDSAVPGALPFLDLMQLVATQSLRPGGHRWGGAVVQGLLPWARRGGDGEAERYAAALGIPHDAGLLRALVAVYWLEWLGYQLERYPERRADRRWVRGNVRDVLDALVSARSR